MRLLIFFCIQSSSNGRQLTDYRRHVFHDLKPYVCTFNCSLKMFNSRSAWFTHELQHHRREYTCHKCSKVFSEKASFSSHLTSEHNISLAGSDLEALILQSEEPVDRISASACLICNEWKTTLEDPSQDAKRLFLNDGKKVEPYGTLNAFRRHLGRHMEQLALFALPKGESPDEMEDDSAESEDSETDTPARITSCHQEGCNDMSLPGTVLCSRRKSKTPCLYGTNNSGDLAGPVNIRNPPLGPQF